MMLLKKEYIIFKVSEKVIKIHMFVFYENFIECSMKKKFEKYEICTEKKININRDLIRS